ncbi:uncharacterized protein LOC143176045 [Nomia melanderi]|uniref:uncharacterized protein LOC143176045 n=1 Tax=Nomia melanderi TaxID=2448451 RepID=UPI003FCE5F89
MEATLKQSTAIRGQIKASLTRFKAYLDSFNHSSSVTELQKRLEKITPLYEKFDTVQCQIESSVEGTPSAEEHTDVRDSFENSFFQLTALAEDIISRSQAHHTQSTQAPTPISVISSTENRIKLPTIELPTFDGSYNNWVKFRDTFESLIHNNPSLSNIEKFHYLNASVKGNAARTIQALGISELNYTLAWNRIRDRYEDLKTLKYHHVRSMYETPSFPKESLTDLRHLIDNVNNNLLALKALGEPTDSWDTLIIYLLTSKLDINTQREWERRMNNIQGDVSLHDMMNFLENHCKYLERITADKIIHNKFTNEIRHNKFKVVTTHVTNSHTGCPLCTGDHQLYNCSSFLRLSPIERRAKIQDLHICFNCFTVGHRSIDCTRSLCKKCSKKHNTLLHIDYNTNASPQVKPAPTTSRQNTSNVNAHTTTNMHESITAQTVITQENKVTMLATALVYIKDHRGIKRECRALLDSGSQSHFMSEKLANTLQLNREKINVRVSGISKLAKNIQHQAHTNIISRFNGFSKSISCLILPTITDNIPNRPVDSSLLGIPSNMFLADPYFNVPREVDMIIGGDLFWDLMCVGRHSLGPRHPSLQKTQLGWIIVGKLELSPSLAETHTICHLVTNEEIHKQLAKFCEIENDTNEHTKTPHFCEEHFNSTATRDMEGRYTIAIPFKENLEQLGNSMHHAEKRLHNLERKPDTQPDIREEYTKFLEEYESLGHMSEVTNKEELYTHSGYYLPHHAVYKANSTTTKLRVVFDGSAKTTSGLSLNDVQWVGPVVQDDLISILLRFRKHRYDLSADIAKMYRQVWVREQNRKFHRILWRKDKNSTIKTFKAYMCVFVCFSTKAVHLELAIDMTTQSFLNCLKRFIARRGLCHTIFSDNGTNFIGARNELLDLSKLLVDKEHRERVEKFLSENKIQWHLTPPRAPHFGGLWEGAVKSTKNHLKRVIGETRLTYEEMYTVLTQVEACLNSRPLSPLSDDPADLSPLTPGHFLTGDSLTAFPEPDLKHIQENRLSRYQHLQSMLQHFWQRWQAEYLISCNNATNGEQNPLLHLDPGH